MTAGQAAVRRYQRMLRSLLPSDLLLDSEAEMLDTFAAAHARVSTRSIIARAIFWAGIVFDLAITAVSERVGHQGGWTMDLKHVLRGLAASRSYTAVAVLSLAVGIGANSSVFSVIRVLLMDPIQVRAPQELALVYWNQPGDVRMSSMNSSGYKDPASGLQFASNYSYPMYESVRAMAPDGVHVSGFNFLRNVSVQVGDSPAISTGGLLADGEFFPTLAPAMALGRVITADDDEEGAEPVVVLSHRLWMRALGGDPSIVGSTIRINSIPTRVIGVTAAEYRGLSKGGFFPETEVTLPLKMAPIYYPRWVPAEGNLLGSEKLFWVRVIARVPDGVSRSLVGERLAQPITGHLLPLLTKSEGKSATTLLVDGTRGLEQTRPETKRLLYILMGVVGVVLTIACINLAGLMLARGVSRQREMAVRRALGAGRGRLIRVVVLEALVLAVAGGTGGLVLTWISRAALTTLLTAGIGTAPLSTQPMEVSVDTRLVLATFGLSLLAALLFSLLPAWRLSGDKGTSDLRQQVVGSRSPKLLAGRLLVALQIAVTMPLVVGAVLFLRTVSELGRVDLGFDPQGIVFFKIDPAVLGLPEPKHPELYVRLMERIRAIPGVTSVSLIENALMSGYTSNNSAEIDGRKTSLFMNAVGPDFVQTMGMKLLAGRTPGLQDGPGAPPIAAINETAAKKEFGDASPLGRQFKFGSRTVEIVGVVSDSRYDKQRAAVRPTVFDSALQRPGYGGHHILIRSALPVEQMEAPVRQAVADVHRDLPVPLLKTQVAQMEESTIRERVFAQLLTIFGGFTLLLASIGLYGVTSYAVRRRTGEIGVRMALGANRGNVLWMIQRQVVMLALIGLAAGVPIAVMVAPLVESLLFGVAPRDVTVITVSSIAMLVTAVAAGLLPARRAASLDPLRALRTE
jgi:predicted permease